MYRNYDKNNIDSKHWWSSIHVYTRTYKILVCQYGKVMSGQSIAFCMPNEKIVLFPEVIIQGSNTCILIWQCLIKGPKFKIFTSICSCTCDKMPNKKIHLSE